MEIANATSKKQLITELYDAFGKGDVATILEHIADDCTWIAGGGKGRIPASGVFKGKEAGKFFGLLNENEQITSFNVKCVHDLTETEAVAAGDMSCIARNTGKGFDSDWVMYWRFNDEGKVVYFQDYFDTAEAYLAHQK